MLSKIHNWLSWCFVCKEMTGTRKEKLGKGQGTQKYCKKCGANK